MRCCSALLCLLASQAVSGPFDGVWSPDPAQCATEGYPYRVTVTDRELRFYEDRCELGTPRSALSPAGALIYDAQCEGLGSTWSGRIVLIPDGDGGLAIMEGEGNPATLYRRCS